MRGLFADRINASQDGAVLNLAVPNWWAGGPKRKFLTRNSVFALQNLACCLRYLFPQPIFVPIVTTCDTRE
jgi:hypothetical protein